jgi:hypothetical protein
MNTTPYSSTVSTLDDDTKSQISSTSKSNEKLECPHCNKEFQAKALFNHLFVKHPSEFEDHLSHSWGLGANAFKTDIPVRLAWEIKNDFDETEIKTIYGCLSSFKAFQNIDRGLLHFKKNPNDLEAHKKQMFLYQKKFEKETKKIKNITSFQVALQNKDSWLARCIYSRILFLQPSIESLMKKIKGFYPLDQPTSVDTVFLNFKDSEECILSYNEACEKLTTYLKTKELNPLKLLEVLYVFENLSSVGYALKYSAGHNPYGSGNGGSTYYEIGHPKYPQVDF